MLFCYYYYFCMVYMKYKFSPMSLVGYLKLTAIESKVLKICLQII